MANRPPRLAIVGASVRAAAFSALRGGFEVVAADMFADADLGGVCPATRIADYPEGLAAWLESIECDAWLYTGAIENHAPLVDRMAAVRPLLGHGGGALQRARDPMVLKERSGAAGVGFPETRQTANSLPLDGTWLCKTYAGASGSGVWRLDGAEAVERAHREKAVFQKYVEGESAAAVFVIGAERAQLLGVTRQLLRGGHHPWQYAGSVGPMNCSPPVLEQLVRLGEMLRELGARGVVGVDLVLADDRAWIIEINPRYTASVEILERAAGISAVAAHVVACDPTLAIEPPAAATATTGQGHAKRILFASRDVEVSEAFHDWAIDQLSVDACQCQLADIPHAQEQVPAGRPVLTVFGDGATEGDAMDDLHRRVGEVERRLYDG